MKMPIARLLPLALLLSALAGCASPHWNGEVELAGSVREVLRDGRTEGRASLWRAERRDRWGLGALEGLAGEVVVADGFVWTAAALSPTRARTAGGLELGAEATLLALARVPSWREVELEAPLDLDALWDRARVLALEEGWDVTRPVPVRIDGPLEGVELHVVAGACPRLHPEAVPFRGRFGPARGTLVGFLAEDSAGALTHHGDRGHLHALLREPSTLAGHVDAVRAAAGARLAVPLGKHDG